MNVLKQDILKSEVMWCIEVAMCSYSYHSCEKKNGMLVSTFPDSQIAFQFLFGKTKCAYMILYEIAPYVTCVLNDALQEVSIYSLSIDLSYNRSLKKIRNGPFDSFLRREC